MVIGFRVPRQQKRHFVHMLAEMRKNLRDHFPRLTLRRELERRLHEIPHRIFEKSGGVLELGIELADRFSVPSCQFRVPGTLPLNLLQ